MPSCRTVRIKTNLQYGVGSFRTRSGHFRPNIKTLIFNSNLMDRTKSIRAGRSGLGQKTVDHSTWHRSSMSQASHSLSPFPIIAEVAPAARKPKTPSFSGD
jgi:hypothetical protein